MDVTTLSCACKLHIANKKIINQIVCKLIVSICFFAEKAVRRLLKNKAVSYFAGQNDESTQLIKNPQPAKSSFPFFCREGGKAFFKK